MITTRQKTVLTSLLGVDMAAVCAIMSPPVQDLTLPERWAGWGILALLGFSFLGITAKFLFALLSQHSEMVKTMIAHGAKLTSIGEDVAFTNRDIREAIKEAADDRRALFEDVKQVHQEISTTLKSKEAGQ